MYYVFASLVVGAFLGGSAWMTNQDYHPDHVQSDITTSSYTYVDSEAATSPIVDDQALSAELALSLGL
jgi:hypothetical protein